MSRDVLDKSGRVTRHSPCVRSDHSSVSLSIQEWQELGAVSRRVCLSAGHSAGAPGFNFHVLSLIHI